MTDLRSLDMRRPESSITVAKTVCALPPNEKAVCIRLIDTVKRLYEKLCTLFGADYFLRER